MCDEANYYFRVNDTCVLDDEVCLACNYQSYLLNGSCYCNESLLFYMEDGACLCNATAGYTEENGTCVCDEANYYFRVNDTCVLDDEVCISCKYQSYLVNDTCYCNE